MSGFFGSEGLGIPIIEARWGDLAWKVHGVPSRYPGNPLVMVSEASGTFEGKLYPEAAGMLRYYFEQADRRDWISAVKRRLGLIGPDDDAAARMAQWEHDHLTAGDLPAALRSGARELDAELTLEIGRQVPELQACPPPAGSNSWQYWPPPWPEPATAYVSSGYLWGRA